MIIRGATVIDGTGAPPNGPVDIVIEGNRITEVRTVGYPKVAIDPEGRPKAGDHEIDGSKMYVLPGFVDMHGHIGGEAQGTSAEYVFKLWLAHGVTTVREPGSGNGTEWTMHERERSAKNQIVAPRIWPYVFTSSGFWDGGPINSPEQARKFVQWAQSKGYEGLKIFGAGDLVYDPQILGAMLDEAKKRGLGSTTHINQMGVARSNVLQGARLGLRGMEHWYGLPEALFADRTIQDFPTDYNYSDEQHRFGNAGRLWKQAAPPGSAKWNAVMDELLKLGFTLDPTLTIYEASRDLMRAMRAEWHDRYTLPSLWQFYQPSRKAHGSYWFNWTTTDEIEWKRNYRLWMEFINEYKNRGGRVTTGSDSGFIYKLYGFDYIRELELLQEAGFHPLEVIRAATLSGAESLVEPKGKTPDFGTVCWPISCWWKRTLLLI
jgi:imidazolonepropionase-like amidohydrolase